MAKAKRKYDKPLKLDMPFEEALGRFAQTDPNEIDEVVEDQGLQLFEDEQTGNRLLPYATPNGFELDLIFEGDEPWFTQLDLAIIFGVDVSVVNRHISNFIDDGELDVSTFAEFARVRTEGKRQVTRHIKHYDLDVAFYVGYRVNSTQGKLFRKWATAQLTHLAKHGFVINKRMLKGNPDRLRKLREIIKEIRGDEANVYAELRQILSMCSDYESLPTEGKNLFFATFQNRLLYAVVGNTAAEIKLTANAKKENMGLQTWDGKHPLQEDAMRAKNYLGQLQIEDLNSLTTMVLDFFEDQTKRGWITTMSEADAGLGEILHVNKRHDLPNGPRVTTKAGDRHVKAEYKVFNKARRAKRKELALKDLNEAAQVMFEENKSLTFRKSKKKKK